MSLISGVILLLGAVFTPFQWPPIYESESKAGCTEVHFIHQMASGQPANNGPSTDDTQFE